MLPEADVPQLGSAVHTAWTTILPPHWQPEPEGTGNSALQAPSAATVALPANGVPRQ
jgi:hypothetical protein